VTSGTAKLIGGGVTTSEPKMRSNNAISIKVLMVAFLGTRQACFRRIVIFLQIIAEAGAVYWHLTLLLLFLLFFMADSGLLLVH
jgi:hypothetical protein